MSNGFHYIFQEEFLKTVVSLFFIIFASSIGTLSLLRHGRFVAARGVAGHARRQIHYSHRRALHAAAGASVRTRAIATAATKEIFVVASPVGLVWWGEAFCRFNIF